MDQQGKSYFGIFRESLDNMHQSIRVVMFADIVGSTQMKSQGVVTWLPTVGKFYDIFSGLVEEHHGRVVKFLGDGALAEFSDDAAENGINAAIRVQETLMDARGGAQFLCDCSIAITTGRPVAFTGPSGEIDLVGTEVDLAARLCGSAASGAIWVDTSTLSAANMGRVSSRVGKALIRTPDEYHGGEETIQLKGFREPVRYREIVWDRQPYGVRNEVVSGIVTEHSRLAPVRVDLGERNWHTGRIDWWNSVKAHGFVQPDDGSSSRYVIGSSVVGGVELAAGDQVAYLPRPAVREGRNETAACVVKLGETYGCSVLALPEGREFGFVTIRDRNGNQGRLYLPVSAYLRASLSVGGEISAVVTKGRTGVIVEAVSNAKDDQRVS